MIDLFRETQKSVSCSISSLVAVTFIFPKAIGQHPYDAATVVNIIELSLVIALSMTALVYPLALAIISILNHFFFRRPFKTVLKASSMFALAPFAFVGTMFTLAIIPGRSGEVLEGVLMVAVWLSAIGFAIWTLRKRSSSVAVSSGAGSSIINDEG